jgi:hypothetical protein
VKEDRASSLGTTSPIPPISTLARISIATTTGPLSRSTVSYGWGCG